MVLEVFIICVTLYALFGDFLSAKAELMVAEAEYREQQTRAMELENSRKECNE